MFRVIMKLAWASLSRRRGRSLLVISMIAVCLWGLLSLEGLYDGMIAQMIQNATRSDSGDISIFAKGYRQNNELAELVDSAALDKFLKNDGRILSFSKRIMQSGLVATAHYARNITIYGIDLTEEQKNGRLNNYIVSGEYSFANRSKGAIIGAELASKLSAKIGSKIIISAQNMVNEVSSSALKITGILKTHTVLDKNAVFIDRQKARDLLMVPRGITQVLVTLKNRNKDIAVIQGDLAGIDGLEVWRWDEIYPALLQSKQMNEKFNLIISFLVFCVAGLGIFGVMSVSVLERMREFGIMLALGTKFSQIGSIIMLEAFLMAIMGFGTGSVFGGATLYYLKQYGLNLAIFSKGLEAFGMDSVMRAVIRPQYFFLALAAVMLAAFVSALLPLRFLQRAKPVSLIQTI